MSITPANATTATGNDNLNGDQAQQNGGVQQNNGQVQQNNDLQPDNRVEAGSATIVRLPLPTIVRDNIELWFIQLDHWFSVNRIISDQVRYSTVIAALDASLLQQVYDVVRNPPAPPSSKYDAIKAAIIHNFTESEQRRAQQFVSGLQLGDKKPSHLLNELRRMGGETQDERLLKILWMNRLPVQVQTCLATVTQPLNTLAELADSVMETFRVGATAENINVVNTGSTTSKVNATASENNTAKSNDGDAIGKLVDQVAQLAKQLAKIQTDRGRSGQRGRSAERSTSTNRQRSSTPAASGNSGEDPGLCWYHRTYGNDARNCRGPCSEAKN